MTEPTRIIPKDGVGPYRNFTSDFEAIRARALHAWQCRFNKELPWPNIKDDALYLAILVQTLVEEKLDMAERHVKYYTALARDMKRSTRPSKLGQFVDSLSIF